MYDSIAIQELQMTVKTLAEVRQMFCYLSKSSKTSQKGQFIFIIFQFSDLLREKEILKAFIVVSLIASWIFYNGWVALKWTLSEIFMENIK